MWGLPCRARYLARGALLPHLFTLTLAGGLFSVALSVEIFPRFFKRHTTLWSPEVPLPAPQLAGSGYLAATYHYTKTPPNKVELIIERRARRLFPRRAKAPICTGGITKCSGFFKRGIERGENHQLGYFLPGFKHKISII